MVQSILVYGILLLLMIFLSVKYVHIYNNGNAYKSSFWQLEVILILLLFSLVSGIRYDVGVDYLTYLDGVKYIIAHPYVTSHESYETGFIWVLKIFAYSNAHPTIVFGFFALLQLFFIFYAFKKERYLYPFLSFIILTAGFYFTMMNEIRQSIVWCALILAVQYSDKKNVLKYLLLVVIGLIFHSSTILLIPIFFLLNSKKDFFKSTKIQLVILFSVIALAEINFWDAIMDQITFLINLLNYGDKYGDLGSRMEIWQMDYSKGIRYFGPLLIYTIIIIYSPKLKSFFKTPTFIKYYNLFFIGTLCFFITYTNTIMQRPVRYFIIMQLVISAYFFFYIWKKPDKKMIDFLVLIIFVLIHIGILTAFIKSDHHTNYLFYWQH